jgi:hypothetical protein
MGDFFLKKGRFRFVSEYFQAQLEEKLPQYPIPQYPIPCLPRNGDFSQSYQSTLSFPSPY